MTTKRTKALPLAIAALAAGSLFSSCRNSAEQMHDHWNFDSVPPRIAKAATGYDPTRHGTPEEFARNEWNSFALTLRRHFLNSNPYNPNQPMPAKYRGEFEVPEIPPNPYE